MPAPSQTLAIVYLAAMGVGALVVIIGVCLIAVCIVRCARKSGEDEMEKYYKL